MDPEFLQAVRDNLLGLGYKNLSDALDEEFARRLQQDEGLALSPAAVPRKAPKPAPRAKPAEQPKKKSEASVSDAEESEEEPEFRPTTIASPPRKSGGKAALDENAEDEISQWSNRLRSIENKAHNLNSQIQECKSAIIDPAADENQYTDVPLYYGSAERGLDPYPALNRKISGGGGFIRPLPVRASRRPAGKNPEKGKRLLYEQRFPDYVPGPEQRRDALRWRIRQQIEYSDPRYHQGLP
jgi:hypothetical protein